MKKINPVLKTITASFVIFILITTIFGLFTNVKQITFLLHSITTKKLVIILIPVLFNYLLRFIKWNYFLNLLDIKINIRTNLWIFFSAFTMALSPGKLGELIKSVLIKNRFNIPIAKTAPIIMTERITDLLGLIIICLVGLTQFKFGKQTVLPLAILLMIFIITITKKQFWQIIEKITQKFDKQNKILKSVNMLKNSTQNLLSLKSLLIVVPLSVLSWAGEGIALYIILKSILAYKPNLFLISLFAHALGSIIGALSFIPGGLLATETSMSMFFIYVSIPKNTAITAVFAIRAVTLWFAVLLGSIIFILGYQKNDLQLFSAAK